MAAVERPLATGDAEVALASSPFRWRRFLSDEEVDAIHDVGREAMEAGGAVEDRSAWGQPAGTWRVAYLNEGGVFERRLPQLYSKIRAAAQRVAAEQGWGVLSATSAPVNFRCVEYHVMREGGGLLSRRHRTKGSLVRNISVLTDFLSSEAPRRGLAANHRPHAGRRGRSMTLPLPTPGLCAARCRQMRMEIDPFKSAGSPKRRPTPGQHFPGLPCFRFARRGLPHSGRRRAGGARLRERRRDILPLAKDALGLAARRRGEARARPRAVGGRREPRAPRDDPLPKGHCVHGGPSRRRPCE